MEEKRLIVWNASALETFANELEKIAKYSYTKAEQVEKSILTKLRQAIQMPERHHKDKYKTNNPGAYRAFETEGYRVSYRFSEKQVRVLRIRHVRQKPLNY